MDFSKVIERVAPSIAKVIVLDNDDRLSTGSGFVYGKKGTLVTCNHVIQGSKSVLVRFHGDDDKTVRQAKVAVTDPEHDLALLRLDVDREPLHALSQKALRNIRPGMPVLFSGYPLSLSALTTHQGILSAVETDAIGVTTYLIDGTVNAGNSGCPLMNENGEVLGVVNAKRREKAAILNDVEEMQASAISLHGVDLVAIYKALVSNVQLGIGYAVPASYIPDHKQVALPARRSAASKKSPAKTKGPSKKTRAKPRRKA
jgi:S1-C subfamily serine protease